MQSEMDSALAARLVRACEDVLPSWADLSPDSCTVRVLHGAGSSHMFSVHSSGSPSTVVVRVFKPSPVSPISPLLADADASPSPGADVFDPLRWFGRPDELRALLACPQAVLIDRSVEDAVLIAASDAGLGSRVFGRSSIPASLLIDTSCALGERDYVARVEEWINGPTLVERLLHLPHISVAMAAKLARLHSIDVSTLKLGPSFADGTVLDRVLRATLRCCQLALSYPMSAEALASARLPTSTSDSQSVVFARRFLSFCSTFTRYDWAVEVDWLLIAAAKSGSPIVLTHNDTHASNWMYPGGHPSYTESSTRSPVELIDYEWAGMNYRGFDFGTLFCEFGFAATDEQLATDPHFSFDSCNYPSADTMRSMFAMYAATVSGPAARSVAVDDLLAEVPVFMMAAHLFWGLNCLAMALSDMADKFNYIACAEVRMSEYLRLKALLP